MTKLKDLYEFQIDVFNWFILNSPVANSIKVRNLILPTDSFFPLTGNTTESKVLEIFDLVAKYSGFEPSSFKAELNDEISSQILQPGFLKAEEYGPSNFSYPIVENGKPTIFYHSSHLSKPTNLIAQFAFDLSLWLTTKIDTEPPGGRETVNLIADIGAAYLGFGIFISNATHEVLICSGAERETGQMSVPDRYIFVEEHACSVAIFCLVKKMDPKTINNYCHPELLHYFKKAYKTLENSNEINALKKLI